jgi:hypothetical protein
MVSILGSALAGITRADSSASAAATGISRLSSPPAGAASAPSLATDFVTLSVAGTQLEASTTLAETAREDDRTVLDMFA